jgi:tetratricopeptide (TPR) repeat protein
MSISPGSKVNQYEILAPVGSGGMGQVFRARDTKLGRQVAIKVLAAHLASNAEARERLRREAQSAASLDHPFICKVFEIGEADGSLFLVMEFLTGETLFDRLRAGKLPLDEALRIAREIGEALEEAHKNRFLHRDLKPANVMLTQGHLKVMDFGLARQFTNAAPSIVDNDSAPTIAASPAITEQGAIVGTPDYMSPEQVRGAQLDQRSDLFSFGILLCELLAEANPFRRDSATETMAAILRDQPNLAGNLPQGLMIMIRRLLAKDVSQRYQSMTDVLADLDRQAAAATAPKEEPGETPIPLIGREQEFAELKRAMNEAIAGRGSIVMVGGEPGIGKTHLTGAILEEARRRGAVALIGHSYEGEGAPPYIPWVEIMERIVRTAPHASLRVGMGDDAPEIARLIPELRTIYPDMPPAVQLPPEQQRRFLFNAVRSWIERAVKVTPAVTVFEDLHWADEPTLLLLQHVAQNLPTMAQLFICTYRETDLDATRPFAKTLETMLRQKQATRISLRRLPVSGVEAMLAAMSGQKPPPSLARVVFNETEGNPFFVEEVFRHLSEEGKLFDETGKWLPGLRVDQLQVPEGVRLVLGRRLDRLGVDARRILTTAAVIGRSFSLRLLEELENKKADEALDAVEEAEKAHLVVAEPAGRDTRYRFVHELVRHTLAESLSLPRRQRIHARVADAIERVYAANLAPHTSALAHHLYQAGAAADPEKTSTYLEQAAKQATGAAGHEEALAHLDNALSLWEGESSLRVAELTALRANALRSMGRFDEAVAGYERAMDMFEAEGAIARTIDTSVDLLWIHGWRADVEAGAPVLARMQMYLDGADLRTKIILLIGTMMMQSTTGNVAEAALTLEKVKALHHAAGIPFAGVAANAECELLWNSGQYAKLMEASPKAAAEFRKSGDRWLESDADRRTVYMEYCFGRPAQAAAALPDAILRAERTGHYGALWALKSLGSAIPAALGDLASSEREAREAYEFGKTHGIAWSFSSWVALAEFAFNRGDLAAAEQFCSDPSGIEPKTYIAGMIDSTRFSLFARSGDERATEAWARRSWKLPVAGQLNSSGSWIALINSVVGLASMERKEDVALMWPLTEELLLTGAWMMRISSLCRTVAGIAAACAGDWAAAEEHHRTAIYQADTAPYMHLQPVAREWYAAMLLDRKGAGDLDKGRALLEEAIKMYEAMGMTYPAKLAREKLAAI